MGLTGKTIGQRVKGALSSSQSQSYEDIEGITISLGVIFALLLPAAMGLQYLAHDQKVQERNFFLLLCGQPDFRSHVVAVMESADYGDLGTWQQDMFGFVKPLGGGRQLDTKAILNDQSYWTDKKGPESIYDCANSKEAVATAEIIVEDFPVRLTNAWAIMNPDVPLWSDHLHAMCSWAMCMLKAGLLGSLFLYISLSASPGREDKGPETGVAGGDGDGPLSALEAWSAVGVPTLGACFLLLIASVIVLLFAQDAYVESQDPFAFRSGRWGNYSKVALLAGFLPCALA